MSPDREREPLEVALRALNRREHSVAELGRWLGEKGFSEGEVDETISELVETRALDDDRYARAFSEDKRELGGWGPERIAGELAERGIEQALIDRYCASEAHDEQVARARELLRERALPLDDDQSRNRALGLLNRRGYGYEVACEVIRGLERDSLDG